MADYKEPTLFDLAEVAQRRPPVPLTDEEKRQAKRDKKNTNPLVAAYGKGPEGTTCSTCFFLLRDSYHDKTYRKCEKREVTRGAGTDHKASFPACHLYQQADMPRRIKSHD